MRIYQRGGDNWGFSYGLGGVLLLAFAVFALVGTVAKYVWPVLVLGLVWVTVKAAAGWLRRDRALNEACRIHDAEHVEGVVEDDCEFCELDLLELKDRERQEVLIAHRRDEAARLRAKYQG